MKNLKVISNIVMAIPLMFVMSISHATTLTFDKITNNNDVDLTGQLSLDIAAMGSDGITFKFYNNVGLDSSLTDVYFDLGESSVSTSGVGVFSNFKVWDDSDGPVTDNVDFSVGAKTPVLPGANGNILNFTSDYDAGAKTVKKGLDQGGEWVTFLAIGASYDDFMYKLLNGTYRIGVKIQSIGGACADAEDPSDCQNDSSTYMVSTVPVPAAGILFASALFGAGVFGRRKKKSTKTSMVGAFTRAS